MAASFRVSAALQPQMSLSPSSKKVLSYTNLLLYMAAYKGDSHWEEGQVHSDGKLARL